MNTKRFAILLCLLSTVLVCVGAYLKIQSGGTSEWSKILLAASTVMVAVACTAFVLDARKKDGGGATPLPDLEDEELRLPEPEKQRYREDELL